jgi:hypothetical protein
LISISIIQQFKCLLNWELRPLLKESCYLSHLRFIFNNLINKHNDSIYEGYSESNLHLF